MSRKEAHVARMAVQLLVSAVTSAALTGCTITTYNDPNAVPYTPPPRHHRHVSHGKAASRPNRPSQPNPQQPPPEATEPRVERQPAQPIVVPRVSSAFA